jgi:hypothetical protein
VFPKVCAVVCEFGRGSNPLSGIGRDNWTVKPTLPLVTKEGERREKDNGVLVEPISCSALFDDDIVRMLTLRILAPLFFPKKKGMVLVIPKRQPQRQLQRQPSMPAPSTLEPTRLRPQSAPPDVLDVSESQVKLVAPVVFGVLDAMHEQQQQQQAQQQQQQVQQAPLTPRPLPSPLTTPTRLAAPPTPLPLFDRKPGFFTRDAMLPPPPPLMPPHQHPLDHQHPLLEHQHLLEHQPLCMLSAQSMMPSSPPPHYNADPSLFPSQPWPLSHEVSHTSLHQRQFFTPQQAMAPFSSYLPPPPPLPQQQQQLTPPNHFQPMFLHQPRLPQSQQVDAPLFFSPLPDGPARADFPLDHVSHQPPRHCHDHHHQHHHHLAQQHQQHQQHQLLLRQQRQQQLLRDEEQCMNRPQSLLQQPLPMQQPMQQQLQQLQQLHEQRRRQLMMQQRQQLNELRPDQGEWQHQQPLTSPKRRERSLRPPPLDFSGVDCMSMDLPPPPTHTPMSELGFPIPPSPLESPVASAATMVASSEPDSPSPTPKPSKRLARRRESSSVPSSPVEPQPKRARRESSGSLINSPAHAGPAAAAGGATANRPRRTHLLPLWDAKEELTQEQKQQRENETLQVIKSIMEEADKLKELHNMTNGDMATLIGGCKGEHFSNMRLAALRGSFNGGNTALEFYRRIWDTINVAPDTPQARQLHNRCNQIVTLRKASIGLAPKRPRPSDSPPLASACGNGSEPPSKRQRRSLTDEARIIMQTFWVQTKKKKKKRKKLTPSSKKKHPHQQLICSPFRLVVVGSESCRTPRAITRRWTIWPPWLRRTQA